MKTKTTFFSVDNQYSIFGSRLLALLMVAIVVSCSDDDVAKDSEFIDQVAQGKIKGADFEAGTYSRAEEADNQTNLYFSIRDKGAVYDNPCGFHGFDGSGEIRFTVPNQTGLYKLGAESDENRKVSLYHSGSNSTTSVSSGSIQITSISEQTISGKIAVTLDEDNTINGNFNAAFCKP
ncbi:MAG: hypothetical protein KI790_06345 [Cyclobacteriaceae bacterium]|nr:hypothetical protein [Cyclobacteriaceae bacterium HetDA_MAG_MS6]